MKWFWIIAAASIITPTSGVTANGQRHSAVPRATRNTQHEASTYDAKRHDAKQPDQNAKKPDKKTDKDDRTVMLFNGHSLDGWYVANYGGDGPVKIKEEKGVLIIGAGVAGTGVTWSGERFKFPRTNYRVTLQAKRVWGTDFFCGMTFPIGEEYATLIVGGWGGMLVGISNINGRDASRNNTTLGMVFKEDQWYRIRLEVTDHWLEVWIDHELVISVKRKDKHFSIRPEVLPAKPFGFTTWMTRGALKNIKLTYLTPKAQSEGQSAKDGEAE